MTGVDQKFHALEEAFNAIFNPADPRQFGSRSLRISGVCDGNRGVQWNAWIEWTDHETVAAYLGVNLEGMKYDGWPIAKLIQHELREPKLLDARNRVGHPEEIRVGLQRNAWQAAARVPRFHEQYILPQTCVLEDLNSETWRLALVEARECLASDEGGRAKQTITLKDGRRVEREMSPYLNFHRQLPISSSNQDLQQAMFSAHEQLQPLYNFVRDRST